MRKALPSSSFSYLILVILYVSLLLQGCGGSGTSQSNLAPPPAPSVPPPVLPPVVPPTANISTSLAWRAPSIRLDGASLSSAEIMGYKIYMGDSRATLTLIAEVDDPQTLSYELNGLSQGTYYFAISVYDAKGLESPLSRILTKELANDSF
jgi:hypothetical protein